MSPTPFERRVAAIWRIESARIVGGLVRLVRDLALAEDLAQEAFALALERWPETGVPDKPGAWLTTAAKRRAIDVLRHRTLVARKHEGMAASEAAAASSAPVEAALVDAIDDEVGDDVLRLMLIACHPVLSKEARVALTLRLLGGLTAEEIARAFLTPVPTVQQRIVRAKRTLAAAQVPFEVPRGAELTARVASVLEVVYLVFNEGYTATHGDEWLRPELCEDALRLGRILAERVPGDPEVHGLVALMELQASRSRARVTASGAPILLLEQDRVRWNHQQIQRGLGALARAETLGRPLGRYALQAAIAACHARARVAEDTDWNRIVALYDALGQVWPSPVVELNRAVAVGFAFGPEAGLELVDQLLAEPVLARYHLLPAVRADLLLKLGRRAEARADLERAAFMATNARERALLLARAKACDGRDQG